MSTEPIARWVLPLRLCPLQNAYARQHWTERARVKKEAFMRLMSQGAERQKRPLPGKPTVRITRLSSTPCDADSGFGAKIPLDCLKVDRQGFGYIRDDSPDAVALECRWEPASPRRGEVIVEVFADG